MERIRYVLEIALLEKGNIEQAYSDLFDLDINKSNVLEAREAYYSSKGIKKYKDYYYVYNDKDGNEVEQLAVRIRYTKIYKDIEYEGVTINGIWAKTQKFFDYYFEDGTFSTKVIQPQAFHLNPVFKGDGTETLVGFSSIKQMDFLRKERYTADKYLQSKNIGLYQLIYNNYKDTYNTYLSSGNKLAFIEQLDNESDPIILATLNHQVTGTTLKIIDLIKMNLQ